VLNALEREIKAGCSGTGDIQPFYIYLSAMLGIMALVRE